MSTLAFDPSALDGDRPGSRAGHAWTAWGACAFVSVMYMLATNNPDATNAWQEVSLQQELTLAIKVESGRAVRQVAFLALGAFGLACGALRGRAWRPWPALLMPIGTFLALAFASPLWSEQRGFTLKRLLAFTCILAAIAGFVRHFRPRDLARLALIGGTLQLLVCVAFEVANPAKGYGRSGYRFSGAMHPNHAGITAALLAIACAAFLHRTGGLRYAAIAIVAVAVLLLTKSRSSLSAFAAALAVFYALCWPARRLAGVGLAAAVGGAAFLLLAAAGVLPPGLSDLVNMGRSDAGETFLTGRPMIWAAALDRLWAEPTRVLSGFGYESFWTAEMAELVSRRLHFPISEGHNAYLDQLLEVGVFGALAYVATLATAAVAWGLQAWRRADPWAAFCCAMLTFAAVHGLSESSTTDPNFVTFISFSAIASMALRRPRAEAQTP